MSAAPRARLQTDMIVRNAQAWREHTGRPIFAVVKNDGYGFGIRTLASALEAIVDGYCVADAGEFFALRALTDKPIRLFSEPATFDLKDVLEQGGRPAIVTPQALEYCTQIAAAMGRPVRVCLGRSPAVGWFGIAADHLPRIYDLAASPWLECELWTHLTTPDAYDAECAAFDAFVAGFTSRGIQVYSRDAESSAPLARHAARFESARIGIGLFGAYAQQIPRARGALSLMTNIVTQQPATEGVVIGYARRPSPSGGTLTTLRLGYGDGFPRSLVGAQAGNARILHIGMQYTVVHSDNEPNAFAAGFTMLDEGTDLIEFCAPTTGSAHELVTTLGLASRVPLLA